MFETAVYPSESLAECQALEPDPLLNLAPPGKVAAFGFARGTDAKRPVYRLTVKQVARLEQASSVSSLPRSADRSRSGRITYYWSRDSAGPCSRLCLRCHLVASTTAMTHGNAI